jgi:HAD superfamily hydrolase (TIGR01484 family)
VSKKLIIFDLDGTLAKSKCDLKPNMAAAILQLLGEKFVAVISGCSYAQFETQFLKGIKLNARPHRCHENLFLLPTCGSQLYLSDDNFNFTCHYHNSLDGKEKTQIYTAWASAVAAAGIELEVSYGDIAEDRESQITFSMRGQLAPIEVKEKWDQNQQKRKSIVKYMKPDLPDFEVRIGGSTSIDVTRKGIDKAYGITKLLNFLDMTKENALFIGDALYEGGNDYPAVEMGLECHSTTGPEETLRIISTLMRK